MAIGTFAELRTAVKDWMVADDISDVAFANFVQLAESRMNRELKVRNMYADTGIYTGYVETTSTTTQTDQSYVFVPSGDAARLGFAKEQNIRITLSDASVFISRILNVIPDFDSRGDKIVTLNLYSGTVEIGAAISVDVGIVDATFSTDGKFKLPADFVEIVTLVLNGSPTSTVLAYIAPQQIVGLISTTYPGTPRQYTIIGDEIQVFPTPTEAAPFTMNYLRSLPALALTGTTTNWLLEKAPDIYLYATLLEASIYLQDDAEAQRAQQLYESGKESLMAADARSRNRPWARMIPNISGSYDSRFKIV